jgi:hypothetical protein
MLRLQNGEPFATGVMDYEFRPVTPADNNQRIILRIDVGNIPVLAALDTGGPFFIVSPGTADQLEIDPSFILSRTTIKIRGCEYKGYLTRIDIRLPAKAGNSLIFQPTTFVVNADQQEKWGDLPNFIGIESCLERIRFAIDPKPDESLFYFGDIP